MTLAALSRPGRRDLVLFLHGLGCAKEIFAPLWRAPALDGMALLAPDLPGHGASQGLPLDSASMEGMAEAVRDLLRRRAGAGERLHVVVHSMGGAVGLLLAREPPIELASFVNVEGNLVAEDCSMFSRRTAETDLRLFCEEKFDKLKARARAGDEILRQWAAWAQACPAEAFHASARSVVAWSDSGDLLDLFRALAVPKAYVSGQYSANPDVLAHLNAVTKYQIADCGHFPMLEKPSELARILREVMSAAA
jgi:pimeloyl-ACP methyl ester carboxylesterase